MDEQNNSMQPQYEDEIDIMELLRKLGKEWKLLLKWCVIAAVVGVVVALSTPKKYSVTSTLAPEVSSKNGSGSLGSLASLAGVNLSNMSTTDAVYPDLYPDIVSSTPFIVELFSVPVEVKKGGKMITTDLYDYEKNYTHSPWWSYIVKAPMKALGGLAGLLRHEEKVEGDARVNPEELTIEQSQVAMAISKSISLVVDKKTSVITITAQAQDPHVAAKLSEEIINRLQTYVTSYRTQKSRQDLTYYQQLYNEAQRAYYASQQRYAHYVDSNQGIVFQSVRTEQDRLQNEMNLDYQLYNTCAQQLQAAKAKVQQETPVCAVINPPTVPLRSANSRLKTLFVFIFLGLCLAALWVLWARDWFAKLNNGDADAKADQSGSKPAAELELSKE